MSEAARPSKAKLEKMAQEISALEAEIEAEEQADEQAEGDKEGKLAEDVKGEGKQDQPAENGEETQDKPAKEEKFETKKVSSLHQAYKYDE